MRMGCRERDATNSSSAVLENHGSLGGDGQVRGDVFDEDLLFPAKSAAYAWLDHSNTFHWDPKHGRKHPTNVEGDLGRGANDEPVVLIPVGDHHVRLDRSLLHFGDLILGFEDLVRLLESLLDIPNIDADLGSQIVLCVRVSEVHVLRLIVDLDRAFCQGSSWIDDGRQHLVVHRRFCRHERHAVSNEPNFLVQGERIEWSWNRV